MRYGHFRCCRHCADEPTHDPIDRDEHGAPCAGRWGFCNDGGDERIERFPGIYDVVIDED